MPVPVTIAILVTRSGSTNVFLLTPIRFSILCWAAYVLAMISPARVLIEVFVVSAMPWGPDERHLPAPYYLTGLILVITFNALLLFPLIKRPKSKRLTGSVLYTVFISFSLLYNAIPSVRMLKANYDVIMQPYIIISLVAAIVIYAIRFGEVVGWWQPPYARPAAPSE